MVFERFLFLLAGAVFPLSIFSINFVIALLVFIGITKILRQKAKFDKNFLFFGLFIFSQIISTLFSSNIEQSFKGLRDFWAFSSSFFASYLLSKEVARETKTFSLFLSISSILAFLMALSQFLFGTDFQKQRLYSLNDLGSMQSKGFFTHHLTFAGVMGLTFLFILPHFLKEKKKILLLGAISALFSLLLSQSRGYYFALFFSLFIIVKKNKKYLGVFISIFSLFLLILLFFNLGNFYTRTKDLLTFKNPSFAERFYLTKISLEIFLKSPIIGVGPGNFEDFSEKLKEKYEEKIIYPDKIGFRTKCHSHNSFTMLLAESGLMGLLTFIMFFTSIFKTILKIEDKDYRNCFLGPFIYFIIGSLFEYNLGDAEVVSIFSFLMGLSPKFTDDKS